MFEDNREVPGYPEGTFLWREYLEGSMNAREPLRLRKQRDLKDKVKDHDLNSSIESNSLIRGEFLQKEKLHPSDIDLARVVCPRCGYRTSGYFLDQITGSYNFFCSCCRHEWEY
jgi:DNA-directed RNA polymerase subunit M/transcription elongation factor TFIIS